MAFSALMVHFDGKQNSYPRVRLAMDLANRFQAALIGIAGRLYLPPLLVSGKNEREEMIDAVAEIGEKFSSVTKHVVGVQWRGMLDDAAQAVTNEARAADLVIIGRERIPAIPYYSLAPSVAIFRMGRPVVLAPDEIERLAGKRVMVAWKDVREARRATRDAIPFLRRAERVAIVEVCEYGSEAQSQQHIDDLAAYLLRHEVVVTEKAYLHTQQPIHAELLRFAKDERIDLLVAGAYGHSRANEWVFGGVTRGLLENSPICCLFSH